jgi:hypothetical protein
MSVWCKRSQLSRREYIEVDTGWNLNDNMNEETQVDWCHVRCRIASVLLVFLSHSSKKGVKCTMPRGFLKVRDADLIACLPFRVWANPHDVFTLSFIETYFVDVHVSESEKTPTMIYRSVIKLWLPHQRGARISCFLQVGTSCNSSHGP